MNKEVSFDLWSKMVERQKTQTQKHVGIELKKVIKLVPLWYQDALRN